MSVFTASSPEKGLSPKANQARWQVGWAASPSGVAGRVLTGLFVPWTLTLAHRAMAPTRPTLAKEGSIVMH